MSPLSRAEAGGRDESAPEEEAFDRDLFARRGRALASRGAVAAIPSLAGVLRAADASREARVERSARGRAFVATALAAACFVAALTRIPRVESAGRSIAPDLDAGAARARSGLLPEETAAGTCAEGDYGFTAVPAEARACFDPAAMPTPAPQVSLPPPETSAPFTPAPCEPVEETCGANESCLTPG